MSRKLKRKHNRKKTSGNRPTTPFDNQAAILNEAIQHHMNGNLDEAEKGYRALVIKNALLPAAYSNLAVILKNAGKYEEAISLYKRALKIKPDYADAYNNLGNLQRKLGQLDEAITSCEQALKIKPDYAEAHHNLGNAQLDLNQLDAAVSSYNRALKIKPDFAEAHNNLGNAQMNLNRLEAAIESYEQALQIKPDYAEAYSNLGNALAQQGRLDEAVQVIQIAVAKAPTDEQVSRNLINILSYHIPNVGIRGTYVKAQDALQQVSLENTATLVIPDKTVQQLYQQCHNILASHELSINRYIWQLYRGTNFDRNCHQHMMVFNKFKIIPESCFDCYKVTIEPRTVVELFKLMIVFDNLELPNDNTRKCIVEVRPEISGTYKGLIYCQSLREGKEILEIARTIVDMKISNEIPIFVKRGCSEYSIAYPRYGYIGDNETQLMTYNEEWCKRQGYTDKNLIGYTKFYRTHTFIHSRFTLHDVLVMRSWLAYSATIGDLSYLKISKSPIPHLPNIKRPSF